MKEGVVLCGADAGVRELMEVGGGPGEGPPHTHCPYLLQGLSPRL